MIAALVKILLKNKTCFKRVYSTDLVQGSFRFPASSDIIVDICFLQMTALYRTLLALLLGVLLWKY